MEKATGMVPGGLNLVMAIQSPAMSKPYQVSIGSSDPVPFGVSMVRQVPAST